MSELDGQINLYWPNGKLKRQCHFVKGVRHGTDRMWNDEGVLVDEGSYHLGKPVKVHRRYNKKGKLVEEIEYLDENRFNFSAFDDEGALKVYTHWDGLDDYQEKVWDRFQKVWIEKKGYWDGSKIVYQ